MSAEPRGVVGDGSPTGRLLGRLLCRFHFHRLVVLDTRGWFDYVRCARCDLRGRIPSRG